MGQRTGQNIIDGSPELALIDGASEQRGSTLTRDAVVVGAIVVAGALSFVFSAHSQSNWVLGFSLLGLLVVLPFIFGASMSIVRGLVASEVLAAALVGGMVIGVAARDLPVEPSASALEVSDISVWFIAFPFIAVFAYWLVGSVIGYVWRWVRRIFMRENAPVAHMRSDMVTPRASADFLSRRAKREETQDDAPDADD
jgi:hypothetical protein